MLPCMPNRDTVLMVAILVGGIGAATALAQRPADPVPAETELATDMAESARRFLSSLSPAQRGRAVFPVDGDERQRWHYVPRPRPGIALRELDDAQRALAFGFLATAVSRRGFAKVSTIMALDEVLRRREHSTLRDAGAYFLSVFGEPSPSATWGFRLEGHHISLHLTLVDGARPIEAPAFLGAAPARVGSGSGFLADTAVLGREDDLGFKLLAALDAAQRKAAVYQATAPADILTGPGAKLAPLPGLPADRLTSAQRALLDALLDEVTGNLAREVAQRERARIAATAPVDLVFTWAGGAAPGQPHYYRLAGPSFVYELDNTQAGANHVHTVWHVRDPAGGDFGLDLLRQHYTRAHAPGSPEAAKDDSKSR